MSNLNTLQLNLLEVRMALLTPDWWEMRDLRSQFWRFYANDSAGASVETDGVTIPLQAGRAYIIPAGVNFHARTTGPVRHFYIHFDVLGLYGAIQRELFSEVICLPEQFSLGETVREIGEHCRADAPLPLGRQMQAKAVLYAGLGSYLESLPPERLASLVAFSLEPVLPALRHIETHLAEPLPNRLLADLCCLSEGHFIRRFRAATGQTPVQYVLAQRVRQAAQLLTFTDRSIDRIAEDVGFGSRFYFHRIFVRALGLSPSAYRKAPRI